VRRVCVAPCQQGVRRRERSHHTGRRDSPTPEAGRPTSQLRCPGVRAAPDGIRRAGRPAGHPGHSQLHRLAGPADRRARRGNLRPDHGGLGGRTHEPGGRLYRSGRGRHRSLRDGHVARAHVVGNPRALQRGGPRRRPGRLRRRSALRARQLRVHVRRPPGRRLRLPDGHPRSHRLEQRGLPLPGRFGPPRHRHLRLSGHRGHGTADRGERDPAAHRPEWRRAHGHLPAPLGGQRSFRPPSRHRRADDRVQLQRQSDPVAPAGSRPHRLGHRRRAPRALSQLRRDGHRRHVHPRRLVGHHQPHHRLLRHRRAADEPSRRHLRRPMVPDQQFPHGPAVQFREQRGRPERRIGLRRLQPVSHLGPAAGGVPGDRSDHRTSLRR
jgi:hypothetical protein